MAKFLLVVAVFIVVYLLLRNYRRRSEAVTPPPEAAGRFGEDMVRCRVCGVHMPTSEAVKSRGEFFCSKEHLRLAEQDRP